MSHGNLLTRLVRGSRWSWRAERHSSALPADLDATVMTLEASDRLHAKQGRSTARVRFDAGLSVYLKRHYRLPLADRLLALVNPAGRHSPAAAEWAHLERARSLGISVPEVVAAGEWIGPWGALRSYLMVAELVGHAPLHEALPELAQALEPAGPSPAFKRSLVVEMAEMAAKLHAAHAFHKDLYLCHFFLDLRPRVAARGQALPDRPPPPGGPSVDGHPRWRWKDLGQLLYSTHGVPGIDDRDRLRFWKHYRRRSRVFWPAAQARAIRAKAARYLDHNQDKG